MGTLPSLTKTWRFQVNQATAAGGSGLAACQNLMWALKESLKGSGAWTDSAGGAAASAGNWTVRSSSDGVGGFSNGDGVDRWLSTANLIWAAVAANHSWIVLRQTGIGATFELLIDLTTATSSGAYIGLSVAGYALNGTATACPTAADEVRICNTASWGGPVGASASTLHVLRSTDGSCNRVLICRTAVIVGYWLIDTLAETDASWTVPFIGTVLGTSGAGADQPTVTNLAAVGSTSYTYAPGGFVGSGYMGAELSTQFAAPLYDQVVANDIGASWYIGDMMVYSELVNSMGWVGKIIDQWWTSTALANSDTFPVAGPTRNFAVFGDIVVPWNTSAVTIGGGASTARDGEHAAWSYASSAHLNQVSSAPLATSTTVPILPTYTSLVYYVMQANDSVTGVRYDWTVPSAPDWAGVGYPGPNAASNVSIAGRRDS